MTKCFGIYAGICLSTQDPERKSRVQVSVPALASVTAWWARSCVWPTPSGIPVLPSVGGMVWVRFEGGDPGRPVCIPANRRVPAMTNCFGIYSGICLNTQDPERKSRVQVSEPSFAAGMALWAADSASPTPCGIPTLPAVGDTVWIVFEGGNPGRPVWIGVEP
jgi:hypothetical protein